MLQDNEEALTDGVVVPHYVKARPNPAWQRCDDKVVAGTSRKINKNEHHKYARKHSQNP